jgi:hypothetical protein
MEGNTSDTSSSRDTPHPTTTSSASSGSTERTAGSCSSSKDEVAQLEERLNVLDAQLSERGAPDIDNGSVRTDTKERKEVLCELHQKLTQYDELCCRFIQLKTRPRASRTVNRNIKNWLVNKNGPIHPQEAAFVDARDLISVAQSQKSAFRHVFEQRVLAPTRGLFGVLLQSPPEGSIDGDGDARGW